MIFSNYAKKRIRLVLTNVGRAGAYDPISLMGEKWHNRCTSGYIFEIITIGTESGGGLFLIYADIIHDH